MSELSALSNVSKSTILYYIREGLLPEARKIKSNVHRYSDEHLELIRYIKYMQHEMGSSIEQIKTILKQKNQSFSSSFSMLAPLMQTLSGISEETQRFTKEAFIVHYGFDSDQIDRLLEDGILLPTSENDFTEKEAVIIRLLKRYEEVGVNITLLRSYVHAAFELAVVESTLQKELCQKRKDDNFSFLWQIMLETLFTVKPYLFSRMTHNALAETLKKEILQSKKS